MTFTLEFTEQEAQMVVNGLTELPAKFSYELITKIKNECDRQFKEAEELKEKPKES